ncbi:uncharacterized protein EI97DRAFT_429906 [Westerdykella ornata]|uniref:Altered inheritance of mitochondria protein 21 n=1 Tax=Westerdykella ornata TaxID=318751 RepID=A0A6A6JWF4_WESOR|nr:uncharacterized protein EI97DRAFT_429906 [Westerdykella ornata]KAF2280148.1 hypothetical protein EI97DRAFT_429906 [Westerdykella ornata]
MATPTIPPRPSRSQNKSPSGTANMDVPKIPPRPAKRSVDRSISPHRDTFARSPLNDPTYLHNQDSRGSRLSVELPPRPPSVTLPELGQEGLEYASLEDLSRTLSKDEASAPPQQTKNIAGDLPLHAPKASVPSSTAKSRIQTVTRTDSSQAAAAGIGKLAPDEGPEGTRSGSSAGNRSRPASVYRGDEHEEHGIPEIGVQVPMYPNAGDVQAPTPSPYQQAGSSGVGPSNKGGLPAGRHHGRTKSGREIFYGPPGSYGLHGHGVIPNDEFEQQWYAKHPEELKLEQQGEYGRHIRQDRKEYHWVTDDLDKLVHSSAATGAGLGTSREAIGTPDEQIGYLASEEFASRITSPKPPSGRPGSITAQGGVHGESSLRNEAQSPEQANEEQAEVEDTGVIHIDPPSHPSSRIHGGGYDPPTEDLGPHGGNTQEEGGLITERGYGVPILASDEVQKHPEVVYRQPAVSPELERRASGEFSLNEPDGRHYVTKPRQQSRSSSRGASNKLTRIASPSEQYDRSGTPLEPMIEYEPLFPEDDEADKKPKPAGDKVKRPESARHHFPSQDVWEDAPSSLQLETTVETPQVPEEPNDERTDQDAGTAFEDTKAEERRKDQEPPEEEKSFLPDYTKRLANKHLNKEHLGGSRPNMQQRFPSHDVWEDAPDYGQLVTTVSTPQTDDNNEYADNSPVVDKPSPFAAAKPTVPARPEAKESSPTEKKAAPVIPERPKPSVPARPTKPVTKSSEKLATLESQGAESAAQPKPKPQVPARPTGSKIAALQAGFLKDLNNKLGLGPQAPKPKEPEPEKEEEQEAAKPLQDARKGRAKGPQRRKPARSPSAAAEGTAAAAKAEIIKLDTSSITTVWTIEEDGKVDVPAARMAESIQAALKGTGKAEKPEGAREEEEEKGEEPEAGEKEAKPEEEPETKPGLLAGATKAVTDTIKSAVTGTASSSDDQPINTPESSDAEPKAQEETGNREGLTPKQYAAATQGPTPGKMHRATPAPGEVPTSEPVDMALMEEGKDAERAELGL